MCTFQRSTGAGFHSGAARAARSTADSHGTQLTQAALAELIDDRIVVSEQVFFEEAKAVILPESEDVLDAVRQEAGSLIDSIQAPGALADLDRRLRGKSEIAREVIDIGESRAHIAGLHG